jgi:DNA-binding response OmpR family regulator
MIQKGACLVSLSRLKCVVIGLDGQVATDLVRMLTRMNMAVSESSQQVNDADMVFCHPDAMPVTGQAATGAKIVAVGSEATEESWLSALESGAADYLPMPCQPAELSWILQSHFGTAVPTAA